MVGIDALCFDDAIGEVKNEEVGECNNIVTIVVWWVKCRGRADVTGPATGQCCEQVEAPKNI